MKPVNLRKQISIFIPLADWKAIRHEAARQRIPMTELCRRWLKPGIARIHEGDAEGSPSPDDDVNNPSHVSHQ